MTVKCLISGFKYNEMSFASVRAEMQKIILISPNITKYLRIRKFYVGKITQWTSKHVSVKIRKSNREWAPQIVICYTVYRSAMSSTWDLPRWPMLGLIVL